MSLEKYVGKIAVVTGASSGIGKTVAEVLVKHGLIVVGIARRVQNISDHAEQLSKEKGQLKAFQCDMTNKQQILDTFAKIAKLGPIHVLLNIAGLNLPTNLIDGDITMWQQIVDTNVMGCAIATREAITNMKQNQVKGHIINMNSTAGHIVPDYPGLSMYPATRFAIKAMSETLRLEINRDKLKIKVTNLSPGYVKTRFLMVDEVKKVVEGRDGLATDDVANAIVYILSTPDHVNIKELTLSVVGEYM